MKYVFLVTVFLLMLYSVFAKKHLKLYFAIVTLALSALAYFVAPLPAMDLYRYVSMFEHFRQMGWTWAVNHYGSTNPLSVVFLYAISRLNNDHLLPAIAVMIVYGLSLAILYKAAKRLNAKSSEIFLALLFLLLNLNFCYVVDVVRIYIAYAVMAYFLYIDLVEKKRRPLCFIVYIGLCYFHYAVMVFFLLRILYIFTGKFKGVLSAVTTVAVPLILYIGYWSIDRFTGDSSLLTLVNDKIEGYREYEVFGTWQFLASIAKIGVFVAILGVTLILLSDFQRRYMKNDLVAKARETAVINKFTVFCMYITMSILPFISNYQFVLRTPYFVQMLMSVPLIFSLVMFRKNNQRYYRAMRVFIFTESIVHFAYLLVYVYRYLEFSFVI